MIPSRTLLDGGKGLGFTCEEQGGFGAQGGVAHVEAAVGEPAHVPVRAEQRGQGFGDEETPVPHAAGMARGPDSRRNGEFAQVLSQVQGEKRLAAGPGLGGRGHGRKPALGHDAPADEIH